MLEGTVVSDIIERVNYFKISYFLCINTIKQPFYGWFWDLFLKQTSLIFPKTTQITYLGYFRICFFVEQFPKALVSHLAAAFMLRQSKIPYIFWMLGACGALATRRLG